MYWTMVRNQESFPRWSEHENSEKTGSGNSRGATDGKSAHCLCRQETSRNMHLKPTTVGWVDPKGETVRVEGEDDERVNAA